MINERNIEYIKTRVLQGDFDNNFCKSMWRMCMGNRDKIMKLITDLATKHYGFSPTEEEIEIALGDMNNGVEVEFAS